MKEHSKGVCKNVSTLIPIPKRTNSLLVLQNSTTARKSGNILLTYLKLFSSDTYQSMKTSDHDIKVNRHIYPDAVTCDRMRLIGPKSGQLGPINHCLLEESQ